MPGDYDGDGYTQAAVWRSSTGTWHYIGTFGVIVSVQWGQSGDVLVLAGFDGNGSQDLAVWRPSTGGWHVRNGASTQWGVAGISRCRMTTTATA